MLRPFKLSTHVIELERITFTASCNRRSRTTRNVRHQQSNVLSFLPRCMECRSGLAMNILSVCLSVKRMHCDKTEERSVQIFIPYERPFSLVF